MVRPVHLAVVDFDWPAASRFWAQERVNVEPRMRCTPVCFVCPYTKCSAGIGQVAEVVEDDKNSAMEEDDFLEHEIAIGGENENEEETLL